MKILKHTAVIAVTLFIILIVPLIGSGVFSGSNDTDAVSSATVVIDQPSGEYMIVINKNMHEGDAIDFWIDLFEGRDTTFSFEDVSCMTANVDVNGTEMAESFRSRLPENQMTVRQEDPTLMLSKAEAGIFDIIIMSKEIADAYGAESLADSIDNVVILTEGA